MPSHAFIVSAHSLMNRMSSALSAKSLERASAALASSIFAATVDRVDLAIAPVSVSTSSPAPPFYGRAVYVWGGANPRGLRKQYTFSLTSKQGEGLASEAARSVQMGG